MFSKHRINFFHTISFRLIFWYAVIFSGSCLILFFIVYSHLKNQSIGNVDEDMLETVRELKEMVEQNGLNSAFKHMQIESEISDQRDKFFRAFFSDGKAPREFSQGLWKELSVNQPLLKTAERSKQPEFETIQIPGHTRMGRILYVQLNKGITLQMGYSLSNEWRVLRRTRQLFIQILFFVVIPLSTIIGWLMAKHALREVRQLEAVALDITEGKLDQRMPVSPHPTEVTRLSMTFNDMIDRIQLLLKEEKEITDNIAHDLRSPLTRLKGEVEVALSGERSGEEYRENLESVLEEVNNLQKMVDNLLDISSVDFAVPAERKRTDLCKFMADLIEIFNYGAEEKGITINLDCSGSLPVNIAPSYMQRAIANLLDNAIKYSHQDGVINISFKNSGGRVKIKIADNGIGISSYDKTKIFNRFFRAENSRSQPGNGLGLALAQAIVKSHGGSITVESELDRGTTFIIDLPQ
jgi:heavy metal sensor kinase